MGALPQDITAFVFTGLLSLPIVLFTAMPCLFPKQAMPWVIGDFVWTAIGQHFPSVLKRSNSRAVEHWCLDSVPWSGR